MYYYGVKLHMLGQSQYKTLPIPKLICVTPVSENDCLVGKRLLDDVYGIDVFADKIYKDNMWEATIFEKNKVTIFTPVKLAKGQNT